MCCVMPPNSPATTSVSRIASSSLVLPWSTWPMTVTTGGRGASKEGSTSSSISSMPCISSSMPTISALRPSSLATIVMASSVSDVVAVAISPARNSSFTMSAGLLPTFSAIVCGVAPRTTSRTGRGGSGTTGLRGPRGWRPFGGAAAASAAGAGTAAGAAGAGAAAAGAGDAGAAAGAGASATGAGATSAGFGSALGAAAFFGLGLRGAGGGSSTSRRFGASVALPPEARRRGTRSSGTLEEADLPLTPICSSVPSNSLLVTPSSFASS